MLNVLTEPVICIDAANGAGIPAALPAVYAALMADEVAAFPALRPHQRHAWHAFLVQLGAMAMHRAGLTELPDDAGEWHRIIRGLTPEWPDDEPWQLVVDDFTKPAFMQPPARSAAAAEEYGTKAVKRSGKSIRVPDDDRITRCADGLDMLVTSKNHDLKSSVGADAKVNDWLFALVSLQTMEGYGGRYNYGISRMPSGYGNRPAFSITPSTRPGAHLRRDIAALLECRQAILDEYPVVASGIGLAWVLPWDGTKAEALLIDRMEPFYIEVCRRVRLLHTDGQLMALRANSDARRIFDAKGLTGDPWAPVGKVKNQKDTPPAFLGPRKFSYHRVVDGLFSADWDLPRLLQLTPYDRNADGTMQLVARGMVRGEGGTEGYHERIIPLRPKVMRVFGRQGAPNELEDIARERIGDVGKVQSILRHAIATFACHADESRASAVLRSRAQDNPLRRKVDEWVGKLDEIVDARFFDDLQVEFEEDDRTERERIRNRWLRNHKDGVIDHARKILQDAEDALPCPAIHRYKARVKADSVFWGRLRGSNGLPSAFADSEEENDECPKNSQPRPEANLAGAQLSLLR